jgi:hypothetical protein
MLLLRSLLGLEPIDGRLLADPAIPESITRIELTGLPGRWGRSDAFGRGTIKIPDWYEKHPDLGQVA